MGAAMLTRAQSYPSNLQIRYVSRHRETPFPTSPYFNGRRLATPTESPRLIATVHDDSNDTWQISLNIRAVDSSPRTEYMKVFAWPMFEPETSRCVASVDTSQNVTTQQDGTVDFQVPKRDLAVWDERVGKWVLDRGIYMFEIKTTEDVGFGSSVIKQVSVNSRMVWNE